MKSCQFETPALLSRTHGQRRRAVFLDKDGTLVDDVPYNVDPAQIRLTRNAAAGIRTLYTSGYTLIVISNQSGVAYGYFAETALRGVERRLGQLLAAAGAHLTDMYYCPHHPLGSVPAYARACWGRKPSPGLILQAAREHNIEVSDSWFVGDILDDVEAGRRAGCGTVLLNNGHETEWRMSSLRNPHAVAPDLQAAADIILAVSRRVYANRVQLEPSAKYLVRPT
jgi:histidinol-phosphate phosphatase family protein